MGFLKLIAKRNQMDTLAFSQAWLSNSKLENQIQYYLSIFIYLFICHCPLLRLLRKNLFAFNSRWIRVSTIPLCLSSKSNLKHSSFLLPDGTKFHKECKAMWKLETLEGGQMLTPSNYGRERICRNRKEGHTFEILAIRNTTVESNLLVINVQRTASLWSGQEKGNTVRLCKVGKETLR